MEILGVLIALSYGLAIGYYWGKAKAHTSVVNTTYCSFEDAKFVRVETPNTNIHSSRCMVLGKYKPEAQND
jgi:hypothetical protein